MSGYTCPFSRCRTPFTTYEELERHVMERSSSEKDDKHNPFLMVPSALADEVQALVAANLRLEQSCGYHKAVADSWHEAYALGKIRGR